MSKIVEAVLNIRHRKYVDDASEAEKHMRERSITEDERYKIPKLLYQCKVETKDMFGCQMILFNNVEDSQSIIIYLHGGIYVNEIRLPHILFCDKLAKKINSTVFTPIYPLAPNHTYEETYDIVEKLYEYVLTMKKPVTLIGDSAGGGLAVAFSEYLGEKNMVQPESMVLLSPWLDVSMSGDYDKVEFDPMLGVDGLRKMGETWAGNLNSRDYKVSPMFGNVSKLPKTTLFVGTHEIFYPDVLKFYDKLMSKNVDAELIVGEKMNHVYPLYPLVPESKKAFNHIVEELLHND